MIVQSWVASCSAAFLLVIGYTANTSATDASIDPAKAQIGAMPLLSNMAANAFCSIRETIQTFSPRTPKQKTSTSRSWTSSSCPTGTAITWVG